MEFDKALCEAHKALDDFRCEPNNTGLINAKEDLLRKLGEIQKYVASLLSSPQSPNVDQVKEIAQKLEEIEPSKEQDSPGKTIQTLIENLHQRFRFAYGFVFNFPKVEGEIPSSETEARGMDAVIEQMKKLFSNKSP